jgi:predicted 3-demethylubiquinone-9 3-methyltransferase (glyoxalase superfamily)
MQKTCTFSMFDGKAEEAMMFYTFLFNQSEITAIKRYGKMKWHRRLCLSASFTLKEQKYRCIDSNVKHGFTFTPACYLQSISYGKGSQIRGGL